MSAAAKTQCLKRTIPADVDKEDEKMGRAANARRKWQEREKPPSDRELEDNRRQRRTEVCSMLQDYELSGTWHDAIGTMNQIRARTGKIVCEQQAHPPQKNRVRINYSPPHELGIPPPPKCSSLPSVFVFRFYPFFRPFGTLVNV